MRLERERVKAERARMELEQERRRQERELAQERERIERQQRESRQQAQSYRHFVNLLICYIFASMHIYPMGLSLGCNSGPSLFPGQ